MGTALEAATRWLRLTALSPVAMSPTTAVRSSVLPHEAKTLLVVSPVTRSTLVLVSALKMEVREFYTPQHTISVGSMSFGEEREVGRPLSGPVEPSIWWMPSPLLAIDLFPGIALVASLGSPLHPLAAAWRTARVSPPPRSAGSGPPQ